MERPLPLILLAFIFGLAAGHHFSFPGEWIWGGILVVALAFLVSFLSESKKSSLILAPALFFLWGVLFISRVYNPSFPTNHLIHFAGPDKLLIEGVLYQAPERIGEKTRFYVRAEKIYQNEAGWAATGNLLLIAHDQNHNLRYGDRVRFMAKLYLPRGATNPGAFDYKKYLARRGIWVTAYVPQSKEIVRMQAKVGPFFFLFIEECREKIRNFLDENTPLPERGIIKALILGERGDIARELNEKFIISGANHILSISGLHVALVAAFFFGVARGLMGLFPPLLLRWPLNKISALTAVIPVIFYTFIAGSGVAAVRSTIMMLSLLFALIMDRWRDLYDALFLAAFLILVISPGALLEVSFQLSFLAVLAIIYLGPRFMAYFSFLKIWPYKSWVEEMPVWKRKIMFYLLASLVSTTAAILGTAPLVGYHFNRLSIAGFFSNLLLVPLLGLITTLLSLLTAWAVFWAPPLAQVLNYGNVFLVKISLILVDFFSNLSWASFRISTPSAGEMILIYGIIFWAGHLKQGKRSLLFLFVLGGLFFSLQISNYYSIIHNKELKVAFLDVGQGDAAVIFFPQGKVMVIDGGGSPDGNFDPGERIVAPYLWKEKRKKIDYLVNTHPHPDHLQGLLFLLKNFEVGQIWGNGESNREDPWSEEFQQLAGKHFLAMGREEKPLEINGVKIEFLHPPRYLPEKNLFWGNNASLVFRLSFKEVTFLFTGDIEAEAEKEIIGHQDNLATTVLKAPHHGSKTSSTPQFVEKANPTYVVFSVRSGGKYSLPNRVVLERYEKIKAQIFQTNREGAIIFTTEGEKVKVKTFLPRPTALGN